MAITRPVALCVLDGWGLERRTQGNAPALARTPNFDRLMVRCPSATLATHGEAVGLPPGNIGNSEVGHLHIGAGRTVLSEMRRIDAAIESGEFQQSAVIRSFAEKVKSSRGSVHLLGLISDVGVHSQLEHVVATARRLDELDLRILVHAWTDGRDSAPGLAPVYLETLEKHLPDRVKLVTVGGRYFAMDRDRRWDRIARAWQAIALGSEPSSATAAAAVSKSYSEGVTDEFLPPTVIDGYQGMHDGDGVFIANFRSDRVRQIAAALADPEFDEFDVSRRPKLAAMVGMTSYFDPEKPWLQSVFGKRTVSNTLGEVAARAGKRQFRLAETEKYPHVTYFLNGGREEQFEGEERRMAPSPKVPTYDLKPEMAAEQVAREFVSAVERGFDLIVFNFANPDMVGHTGSLEAAIQACEAVDRGLGDSVKAIDDVGGAMIVTADHGNCETMIDPKTGKPHTAHTTNPVPVLLSGGPQGISLRSGALSDLAPTVLDLMGLEQPREMTGSSLLVRQA